MYVYRGPLNVGARGANPLYNVPITYSQPSIHAVPPYRWFWFLCIYGSTSTDSTNLKLCSTVMYTVGKKMHV